MTVAEVEASARKANSPDLWNRLWESEGEETWRKAALAQVYDRVEYLVRRGARVIDIGGGIGALAARLAAKDCSVEVWDHSAAALLLAHKKGLATLLVDLEDPHYTVMIPEGGAEIVVATEVIEHLSAEARQSIYRQAAKVGQAIFSVPNDCLGPEVEKQHTVQFTAMSFKRELAEHFDDLRIEAYGRFLLAVCGLPKDFTLSVTMPVRNEAEDLERTLASFRGVADQMVIGVDPRTTDDTFAIAEKYADEVFYLVDPRGQGDDQVAAEDGCHFSWVRNQCIDRCTGDYIFMSEGHEHLSEGHDMVLDIGRIMKDARVALTARQGNGQQWAFPWIFENAPDIRFTRPTHNTLDYPDGTPFASLPGIVTIHDRVHSRTLERAKQRSAQNRISLMDDWLHNQNENSLFYLAAEWREADPNRAIERFEQYLRVSNNGVQKYQARLILAKEYRLRGETKEARETLIAAVGDDWSRTEHWVWLGDMAFEAQRFEEAYRFYRYAATGIGNPPFTLWWIDLCNYSYLPAQRLAMVCGELGRIEEAWIWSRKVAELLPDDAPSEAHEEARANVEILRETLDGTSSAN